MSYNKEIMLNNFQQLVFNKLGKSIDSISGLKADASERKIYRLFVDGKSVVGVYNENKEENLAFINFTDTFIRMGFNVPRILNVSDDKLFYIEDDLGDKTLYKLIINSRNDELTGYFKSAISDLIRFQIQAAEKIDFRYCYQTKEFNADVIASDLKKFSDYFLKMLFRNRTDESVLETITGISKNILANVNNGYFLYRDFQPRNIMIKDNSLYYIDYQSGRKGPLQYDAASFLYSGSININEEERDFLLKYYLQELHKYISFNDNEFVYYFYYFALLRLLQVLGSYAYQHKSKNDKEVLKKIPKAFANLRSLIDKIEEEEIKSFIVKLTSS